MGVTFTVYTDEGNIDRAWPLRYYSPHHCEKAVGRYGGRFKAAFTSAESVYYRPYHEQKIVRDGVLPRYILEQSKKFSP